MRSAITLAGAMGVCLAVGMFGQTTTQFTITGDAAGQFTMPYTGTTSTNGPTVPIYCDDFSDEVNINQSWLAFVTDLNQIPDSPNTVYYTQTSTNSDYTGTLGPGHSFTEQDNYIAAAILATEISELKPFNTATSNELSAALWSVFQPNEGSGNFDANAQADLNAALTAATSYANGTALEKALGVDITIYTADNNGVPYTDPPSPPLPGGTGTRPQEFITVTQVPEPSTWAALGFDSLGAGIVGLYFLRRKSRIQS